MAWLLTNDIPAALRRADISAVQIQGALGVPAPKAHLVSYVWTHPYLSLICALVLVLMGGVLAWILESALGRMKRIRLRTSPQQTVFWRRSKYAGVDQASDGAMLIWQNTPEMPLWKAAYLWVGQTPKANYPADVPTTVKVIANRMVHDAKKGALSVAWGFSADKNPKLSFAERFIGPTEFSMVTREALIAYAALRNETPRFLQAPRPIDGLLTATTINRLAD